MDNCSHFEAKCDEFEVRDTQEDGLDEFSLYDTEVALVHSPSGFS